MSGALMMALLTCNLWRPSLQSSLSSNSGTSTMQSKMTDAAKRMFEQAKAEMDKERWHAAIKLLKEEETVNQKNWQFSWNLGWCYFKLGKFTEARTHMIRATKMAPESPECKIGLGAVYVKRKDFKKAEVVLRESLNIKELYITRILLALAYLSQRKVSEAESVHLEGIRRKPKDSQRFEGYSVFLSDVGRDAEAKAM